MNMFGTAEIRPRICVAVARPTTEQAIETARRAEPLADVLEIRLDALSEPVVAPFMTALTKPLLFTNRPVWEGGAYSGGEEKRVGLLQEAVQAGCAYVDIELRTQEELRDRLLDTASQGNTRVIVSWHDFKNTPPDDRLRDILERQRQSGGQIGKIVTMAHGFQDALRILGLQIPATAMGFPLIAFCMGKAGMISRLATLELGGYLTYAAPDDAAGTAPGQLPAKVLRTMLENFS